MALFSRKSNTDTVDTPAVEQTPAPQPQVVFAGKAPKHLVVPRLSEKAGALGHLNKYVFTIHGKMNKIELRKFVEAAYGVTIATVNMVNVAGKYRRRGRIMGKTSDFKKAIVTLTKNSKKINVVEPS